MGVDADGARHRPTGARHATSRSCGARALDLGGADVLVTTDPRSRSASSSPTASRSCVVDPRRRRARRRPRGVARDRGERRGAPASRRWRRSAPSRTGAAPRSARASRGAPTRSATTSPRRSRAAGCARAVVPDGTGRYLADLAGGERGPSSSTRGCAAASVDAARRTWTDGGATGSSAIARSVRAAASRSRRGSRRPPRSIVVVTRPRERASFAYGDVAVDPVGPARSRAATAATTSTFSEVATFDESVDLAAPGVAEARRPVPPARGPLVLQDRRRARRRPRRPRRSGPRAARPARAAPPRRARRVRLPQRPRPRRRRARRAGRAARPRRRAAGDPRPARALRRWHRLDRHGRGRRRDDDAALFVVGPRDDRFEAIERPAPPDRAAGRPVRAHARRRRCATPRRAAGSTATSRSPRSSRPSPLVAAVAQRRGEPS